ncbi:MAG: hypothetical protein M3487_08010, partial [Actinomycetota bacterium]|nr:hypothetical protein [Actinomycetota bacterium]
MASRARSVPASVRPVRSASPTIVHRRSVGIPKAATSSTVRATELQAIPSTMTTSPVATNAVVCTALAPTRPRDGLETVNS